MTISLKDIGKAFEQFGWEYEVAENRVILECNGLHDYKDELGKAYVYINVYPIRNSNCVRISFENIYLPQVKNCPKLFALQQFELMKKTTFSLMTITDVHLLSWVFNCDKSAELSNLFKQELSKGFSILDQLVVESIGEEEVNVDTEFPSTITHPASSFVH
ncbi:MAG: hypothetical protein OCD00_03800 [Colwellia sp.]